MAEMLQARDKNLRSLAEHLIIGSYDGALALLIESGLDLDGLTSESKTLIEYAQGEFNEGAVTLLRSATSQHYARQALLEIKMHGRVHDQSDLINAAGVTMPEQGRDEKAGVRR